MRRIGTAHLMEVMNDYDLLPTKNFQYGRHPTRPEARLLGLEEALHPGLPDGCWFGCTMACAHGVDDFELQTGPYKGRRCWSTAPSTRPSAGCGSNCGIFDPRRQSSRCNFYCDTYGIDTISFGTTDRLRHGVLGARHPQQGAHRRPRPDLGQLAGGTGDPAPDGPRRGLRRDRRQGRQVHEGALRRASTAPTPSS